MPRELSRADLAGLPHRGDAIFVASGTAEPTAIIQAWRETGLPSDITLIGFQFPGLNRFSPEDFGPCCRYRTSFLSPGLREGFTRGRVDLMPMHHSAFYTWLETRAHIDLAIFQACPPDADGRCNLGPSADLLPAIISRSDVRLVAQINPGLPPCQGGLSIGVERLESWYHMETELPFVNAVRGGGEAIIAERVAALIEDDATIQVGIGRLPDQVLSRLAGRRRLKLHGGTVSRAGLELMESGAADGIVAGVAIGDVDFYRRVAMSSVAFRPVPVTHGAGVLAKIPRFIALNAALEVDLFGQANCEVASGRLSGGVGGINDFLRASRASPGGLGIVMLPAQAVNGKISRVVSRICEPGLVSVQRGDVDMVVTEYGVADLRGLDLDARAAALIGVAAEPFRPALAANWRSARTELG